MNMNTEIQGTYGSGQTPCTIYIDETSRGTWYAVEGSCNVNLTHETLEDGIDIETVEDIDAFTWSDGIDSWEALREAIEA